MSNMSNMSRQWENNTYEDMCGREHCTYTRCCELCHRQWRYVDDILKSPEVIAVEEDNTGDLCPPCIEFRELDKNVKYLTQQIEELKTMLHTPCKNVCTT
jgi:hypothetical protein